MNLIHENKDRLKAHHYVRKAGKRWWFDLPQSKIQQMLQETGGSFCIILYGAIDRPRDFFAVPFALLRLLLTPESLKEPSGTHGARWVGDIESNYLSIRKCGKKWHVGAFYGDVRCLQAIGINAAGDEGSSHPKR